ncbi:MAG TPA: DUF6676 family protein [Mycobacterium sp.]|nr:DUF6676 family protein [Mycobacterium sp.]
MTGPLVLPFPPSYIPPDVCSTVGQDPATTPVDHCMELVRVDVGNDGVSLPAANASDEQALREVVTDARDKGIDLKVVVIDRNPHIDTPLRDIATEVGEAYPDSTVLVLSPTESGTYSTTFDRFTLEAGQDVAEGRGPVQGAKNFVSELTTPHFPWTALTIVVTLGVVAAVVLTRVLQVRAKRELEPHAPSGT